MLLVLYDERAGVIRGVIPGGTVEGDKVRVGSLVTHTGVKASHVYAPEQDIAHLRDPDTGEWIGTLADLRQYTEEEKADIERPQKAREALAKIETDKPTLASLAEEIRLIREIIGA
jgi:hypothetical protein